MAELDDETQQLLDEFRGAFWQHKQFGTAKPVFPPLSRQQATAIYQDAVDHYYRPSGRSARLEDHRELRRLTIQETDAALAKSERRAGARKRRIARRKRLRARDGDACWLCGKKMAASDMTIEHRIPKSAGGTNRLDNLVLCHTACNAAMRDMAPAQKKAAKNTIKERNRAKKGKLI